MYFCDLTKCFFSQGVKVSFARGRSVFSRAAKVRPDSIFSMGQSVFCEGTTCIFPRGQSVFLRGDDMHFPEGPKCLLWGRSVSRRGDKGTKCHLPK